MKYYILKWSDNWADEINAKAVQVIDEEQYKTFQKNVSLARKYSNELGTFEISIGSNEEIEYKNVDKFLKKVDIKEIPEKDVKILEKYGLTKFGFNAFMHLLEGDFIEDLEIEE